MRSRALRSSGSAFSGAALQAAPSLRSVRRAVPVAARAMLREYPDPDFIAETKTAFPDKGIATPDEARVLYSDMGYTYLDVRPALELEAAGKFKGCVNVPLVNAKWRYDPELKKKVLEKEDNPQFMDLIKKKFPNLEHPLLVGCSDGTTYSIDALEALDEAGYTNIVGLRGGYYAWTSVFDNNLRRRRSGEYAETYMHDGDTCGIHASGAGFTRVDAIEKWAPPKF